MNRSILAISGLVFFTSHSWAGTFNGYDCTSDCSGHEAGYEWADDNDVEDEDECSNDSASFEEGCLSYLEEKEDERSAEDGAEDEIDSEGF